MHHARRRRGAPAAFTVVELLVVISIMALLMALLVPSLAHARQTARTTTCASNLKQLGVLHFDQAWETDEWALSIYDLDRVRWPLVSSDPMNEARSRNEDDPIIPPPKVRRFGRRLHRAEMTAPRQPLHWNLPCPEAIPLLEMSYGMNFMLRGKKPEHINSREVVFVCSPYRLVVRGRDLRPARHNERVNFMFGDSHVKADTIDSLPEDDVWRRTWRPEPEPAEYPDDEWM